jgi:hypothetical protein
VPSLASAQQTQLEIPGLDDYEPAPMYDPTQGTIRLDVEVKDKSGYPVTGLRQQNFTLQDNGQPGTIVTFQAFDALRERPDPPVEVILVIDELNMQDGSQLQAAVDEAETFLRRTRDTLRNRFRFTGFQEMDPGRGRIPPQMECPCRRNCSSKRTQCELEEAKRLCAYRLIYHQEAN